MAEDGMLINFDTSATALVSQPKFRGGSWKDKLSAKKASLYRRQAQAKPADTQLSAAAAWGEPLHAEFDERSPKRQRLGGDAASSYRQALANKTPKQVVSSLFSFNPTSNTIAQSGAAEPEAHADASNAPLDPELENFTSLGLSKALAEHLLKNMDIKAPTAVQRSAVAKLVGEDVDAFIQAETGSGKTLAYLLPIVQRLMTLPASTDSQASSGRIHRDSGLFAIVLAPTRELSKQISVVLENLLRCAHWLVSSSVTGGEKKKSEKARLRKGVNILIATPGRLADHLDHTEALDVSKVRWLVLDEGDRLMELGFEKDIEKILSKLDGRIARSNEQVPGLPKRRITVLCSATMKMNVQKLGELSLRDAVHVQGNIEGSKNGEDAPRADAFRAPAQLQQSFAVVPAKLRLVSLVALLKRTFARRGSVMKAIVFVSCADSVDFHFDLLAKGDKDADSNTTDPSKTAAGMFRTSATSAACSAKENPVRIFRLHGSLPQAVRTSTLASYRNCSTAAVLICTDVASRGLDVPDVDFVVEFDPPFSKDDHLHRVGRTARAGKEGRAMIFLLPGPEEEYINILKEASRDGGRKPTQQNSDDILKKGFVMAGVNGDKYWEDRATDWQLDIERWALESPKQLEQARRAYQSHIRAYATHVAAERHMFDMTALHLGHLAKAFALRDKPGSIKVPGLRPTKGNLNSVKAERRSKAGISKSKPANGVGNDLVVQDNTDLDLGKQKMRSKMREQAAVSEFNLG